jgi:protoporphyrinogen oxidase
VPFVTGEVNADLVVLGGGPAGLAAARNAARRGLSVTLLERRDHPGGMAASFEVAGVRVDHGSHRLHPATPAPVLEDIKSLLGDDLQLRRRNGRLRVYDHWVGFPLKASELARTVPTPTLARIARDSARQPFTRRRDESYAAALSSSLGPELYHAMYEPYAVKLWGLPGDRIDAEQARVRVTADTPWKVAARLLRRQRGGQGKQFYYPRTGFGEIVDRLAESGVEAGVDLRCNAEVVEVRPRLGSCRVVCADGFTVTARQVLSTLPLPLLARITRPRPSRAAVEAASMLRYRAMVLVYLVHAGGRWTHYDAHYLPGPETPVTRISEPMNYRDNPADPSDRTVLCAEIPCAVGDDIWTADTQTLSRIVRDALRATGLPPLNIEAVVERRLPHVYPVYERGFQARLVGLEKWAATLPSVTTMGRLGLFAHDNTHHALVMADAAVGAIGDDGRWDADAWAQARESFRQHVVED